MFTVIVLDSIKLDFRLRPQSLLNPRLNSNIFRKWHFVSRPAPSESTRQHTSQCPITEFLRVVFQDAPGAHCFSDARARTSDARRKIAPATHAHPQMVSDDMARRIFLAIMVDFTFACSHLRDDERHELKDHLRAAFPGTSFYSM
jgi:hypothetical protein